jgi:hypothetical protein
MHPLIRLITEIGKWTMSTPSHRQITSTVVRAGYMTYRQLSPEAKEKVDAIVRRGFVMVAKAALGDAVSWAGDEAVRMGLNPAAAQLAQAGVRRAAAVGLEKALEEMHQS